jgi:hypothetical protein
MSDEKQNARAATFMAGREKGTNAMIVSSSVRSSTPIGCGRKVKVAFNR